MLPEHVRETVVDFYVLWSHMNTLVSFQVSCYQLGCFAVGLEGREGREGEGGEGGKGREGRGGRRKGGEEGGERKGGGVRCREWTGM